MRNFFKKLNILKTGYKIKQEDNLFIVIKFRFGFWETIANRSTLEGAKKEIEEDKVRSTVITVHEDWS